MATALVLGATGGIGGEMATGLLARGWQVRALVRDPAKLRIAGAEAVAGDAMQAADVRAAARGASIIVHGVNPPAYRNWGTLVLPMLDNTIAAARAEGARVVFPGTVYNFGPDAFPVLREDSPQHPVTRKGRIRAEMEHRLARSGVPTLIVRAGDFFGERAANSWFSQGMVKPGRPVGSIMAPAPGIGHAWGYLPDVAETMLRLLERDAKLAAFDVFHMQGHFDADGRQLAEAIRRAVGRAVPIRRFPWLLAMAVSPFVPFLRELREMRYLWREPLRLDHAKLVGLLGQEPHTPLDAAVRTTLEGLGCLSRTAPPVGSASSSKAGCG